MLASLFVSDLALIRRLSVDFHRGFSVLTGETGAGKSLILDSLGVFLSSGGTRDLVRRGCEKAEVSLYFTELGENAVAALADIVPPEELEEGVTFTRILYATGKTLSKIGGRSVPFGKMAEAAVELLGIHGQMAAAGLLNEKNHRKYLDSALSEKGISAKKNYEEIFRAYSAEKRKLEELLSHGDEKEEIALIDYRMQEIRKVSPKKGEEEALEKELSSLQSYEKDYAALSTAHRALHGGEKGKGALYLLNGAARKLEHFGEKEPYQTYSAKLYEIALQAQEIEKEIASHLSDLGEEDPGDRMDRIQRRLDEIYRLKMRLGKSADEIISYYEELKEKKSLTLSRKDDIKKGKEALQKLQKELSAAGDALREERKKTACVLEKEIASVLTFLDMPKMQFSVLFTPLDSFSSEGTEKVAFGILANTGEGIKPLSQVASGGEMSRIMLALTLKLLKAKDASTLVFDEIDTGISGATAQKIGICMKMLGETRQVFCVTHSAQVATLADHHFLVAKSEVEGRTETTLTPLSDREALRETARLLGGKKIGEEALSAGENLRLEGKSEFEKFRDILI